MLRSAIAKIVEDRLEPRDIILAMDEIMQGRADDIAIGAFLTAMRIRGESIDHLKIMYDSILRYAVKIEPEVDDRLIDTCGTGGDKIKTFNISTAAAFVASLHCYIAKHGNRSNTGYSGSADILESLGYDLNTKPSDVKASIEQLGIGFLFAPIFHPAMRYVSNARKAIGIRTAFNILGPIANPCNIDAQIVGVSEPSLLEKVARLLLSIDREEAMVFHAIDGIDELSTTCINKILWIKDKKINELTLDPNDLDLTNANIKDISINSREDAIRSFLIALNGYDKAKRDIIALNAAAALIIAHKESSFDDAIEVCKEAIDSGKAYARLKELIKRNGDVTRLEELEDDIFKEDSRRD